MIVTITYKMVLVVIGLGLMIFGRGFIRTHMYDIRHIFYLGTGLNVFCVSSMLLLVFHPVLARSILVKGMELLEKMHPMRHKSTRIEKLNASMDQVSYNSGLSERSYDGAGQCICNHTISEVRTVYSNLVCI